MDSLPTEIAEQVHNGSRPMPVDPDVPTGYTMKDPEAQHQFDDQALYETMEGLRKLIAQEKVQLRLAKLGLLDKPKNGDGVHHRQVKLSLDQHREALAAVLALHGEMTYTGLPEDE